MKDLHEVLIRMPVGMFRDYRHQVVTQLFIEAGRLKAMTRKQDLAAFGLLRFCLRFFHECGAEAALSMFLMDP